jgi:hypothetical protein
VHVLVFVVVVVFLFCCFSNMEFLKEAAKLAHEHSKPQGGGGGTSSDGGDYDGALPHPHTTIFSQHATTVSHAGVPDGTAEHTKPSKTELYSSAQVFGPYTPSACLFLSFLYSICDYCMALLLLLFGILFSSASQSLGNEISCLYFPCVCVTNI